MSVELTGQRLGIAAFKSCNDTLMLGDGTRPSLRPFMPDKTDALDTRLQQSVHFGKRGVICKGDNAGMDLSYGLAPRFAKDKSQFGKGDPRGIVSPETADHSAGTSALLPMLALGVPGSATAAVMMGGLMIWGLTPGPMLFIERPDFVWGLIASMYIGNVVAVLLVLASGRKRACHQPQRSDGNDLYLPRHLLGLGAATSVLEAGRKGVFPAARDSRNRVSTS